MVFTTLVFLEFALIFFGLWPIVRRTKGRYVFLIVASSLFYGYAGWWFVPLLLATATIDFFIAAAMAKHRERAKALLICSVVSNMSVLGVFKYSGFAARIANSVAAHLGVPASLPVIHLILPVGISFYTFQSLSYIFDVYAKKIEPSKHPVHFLAIVSLFPHLVAGPIVRIADILPQMAALKKPSRKDIYEGLHLIAFGLFRKMVLADTLAPFVDRAYSGTLAPHGATYIVATIGYAFQIYCDFSGYTDVARGLAKWIGLEFHLNFNHPYIAIGFSDFWSRWHISLSSWIRDYIFIPLGGSRVSEAKVHRNIWVAMLLSGLWHGANFTYVFWGAIHAVYQSLERATKWPKRLSGTTAGAVVAMLLTFALTCIAWVFFRAESLHKAFYVLRMMARPTGWGEAAHAMREPASGFFMFAFFFVAFYEAYFAWLRLRKVERIATPEPIRAIRAGLLLTACLYFAGPGKAFIYFQF